MSARPETSLRDPFYLERARGTVHERDAVLEHVGDRQRAEELALDAETERVYGHMPADVADWSAARAIAQR